MSPTRDVPVKSGLWWHSLTDTITVFLKISRPIFILYTETLRDNVGGGLALFFTICYNKNIGDPCGGRFYRYLRPKKLLLLRKF